jgi:hypothetical protein
MLLALEQRRTERLPAEVLPRPDASRVPVA